MNTLGECLRFFDFTFDVGDTDRVTVEFSENYYADGKAWHCAVLDGDGQRTAMAENGLRDGVMPDIGYAQEVAEEFLRAKGES